MRCLPAFFIFLLTTDVLHASPILGELTAKIADVLAVSDSAIRLFQRQTVLEKSE